LKSTFGTFTGGFETFRGAGGGSFSPSQYVTTAGPSGSINLGEVWAIETGDIDGDGDQDIIVGSHSSATTGNIDIYLNTGSASGSFAWQARYLAGGAVNDLKVVDMMEDDGADVDVLAGISRAGNTGCVMLWLNTAGTLGVPDTTGYAFTPEVTPNWPDDWCSTDAEALSIATLAINNDLFPDVAIGTRSSSLYTGDVYILAAYGTLPPSGRKINVTNSGEIITIDVADFNKDNRPDVVVGTRNSATQGRLVVYFGTD
jgi:hypothetical protein